jgi:hypothetical protein
LDLSPLAKTSQVSQSVPPVFILLIETMEAAPNMTAHFDLKQVVSFFSCLDIIINNFFSLEIN